MMMPRRFRAIAVLALSSLMVTSTSAFSANQMETRRIQRQHQLEAHRHYHPSCSLDADVLLKTVAGIMTAGLLIFSSPLPSLADGSRVVGELRGSGLVFKVRDDGSVLCGIYSWWARVHVKCLYTHMRESDKLKVSSSSILSEWFIPHLFVLTHYRILLRLSRLKIQK